MLIIDFSGIATIAAINNYHEKYVDDMEPLHATRICVFTALHRYRQKFREYGTPVICIDSKPYWRDEVFPYYKKQRKSERQKSKIDWGRYFDDINVVIEDIKKYAPYYVIDVAGCEADDGISVLTQYACARDERVMIVSSDKDMIQLQDRYKNVKQYSPNRSKLLTTKDKDYSLIEHIIRGDRSDGIPNIFSADNVLVESEGRQRTITKKMISDALSFDDISKWAEMTPEVKAKFERNKTLIDTTCIPRELKRAIVGSYEKQKENPPANGMYSACVKYRMRNLLKFWENF